MLHKWCSFGTAHIGWDEVELRISPEELHNSNLHFSLVFHSALYLWSHSPWYQSWMAVVDPTPIPQHHTQFVPEPTAQSTLAWLSAQLMQALEWPRRGDFVSYLKNCSCFYLRLFFLFCFLTSLCTCTDIWLLIDSSLESLQKLWLFLLFWKWVIES